MSTQILHNSLDTAQESAFTTYAALLREWNSRINLTAITDPDGIDVRHFLDSLTLLNVCDWGAGTRLIDVGTGAGFPGLPLKIARPQVTVTLLEATGKKVLFLDEVIAALGLTGVAAVKGRAEEVAHLPQHRESYDVAAARAVARLPVLLEYLLPFVRVGGVCVAMKGQTAAAEANDSAAALRTLGGTLDRIETFHLPGVDEPHHLVIVRKTAPTPAAYPRPAGTPTQKPL